MTFGKRRNKISTSNLVAKLIRTETLSYATVSIREQPNKQQIMKLRSNPLIPLFAASMLAVPVCQGTAVFSDDFSEAPGTPIIGKSPDVGSAWTGTDNGTAVSAMNSLDTTGNGRTLFGAFTSSLGAGEVLTLSYDTLALGGDNFFVGWAGVSLYAGGGEKMFTGSPGLPSWGVDGGDIGGQQGSGDTTAVTSATFIYAYDTGAWSFTTLSGVNLSGTGTSGLALDQLRVANGNNADINLDNLLVDISAVPEPSSIALVGAGMGLLLVLRRRRS